MRDQMPVSPVRYVLKRLEKDRLNLVLAIFFSIVFVLIPMQIPVLTGALVDGIDGKDSTHVKIYKNIDLSFMRPDEVLQFASIGLIAVAVLYGLAAYFRTTSIAKVSRHFVAELRKSLVEKLELLSLDVHTKYGSGDLLNRVILDTQSLRTFIENSIIKTIVKIVQMGYPLVMLFILDPFLASLAVSVLPAQWLVTKKLQKKIYATSRRIKNTNSDLTTAIKESLDGMETIQTLQAESQSTRRIFSLAEKVEENQILAQKYSGITTAIVWTLTTIGLALIWWQGGIKILEGQMSIGGLIAFTGFALFIYQPSRSFTKSLNEYHKGVVAVEHIQEILELHSSIKDSPNAIELEDDSHPTIEFKDVSFSYPTLSGMEETLKNVSFKLEPNTLTAIVGRSGSGKSTILKLIARLYEPSTGQILIDGHDVKKVKLHSLRSKIAIVPQSPMIFTGTVFENITFGSPNASEKDVDQACHSAHATEFISKLKDGFGTRLGQQGTSLSGGQAQRIAIARTLTKKPIILLLDEPSSSLDSRSEAAILDTLEQLKRKMTIILVGHNIKTIAGIADRFIVIDNGKIVQDGVHRELVSADGAYRTLYYVEDKTSNGI
ncbi:MAG: ABC transporter ATP-binding protein [Candidatus Nitrosotenuis sp.]|nr:MAG: ABC transporter ATP-binding protein [Candidatus Nitrosotenuis sp.]